jgi:hypothetical protein
VTLECSRLTWNGEDPLKSHRGSSGLAVSAAEVGTRRVRAPAAGAKETRPQGLSSPPDDEPKMPPRLSINRTKSSLYVCSSRKKGQTTVQRKHI